MPVGPSPETFEAIESAVMETQRGRWFLTEYASRIRSRDIAGLLDQMKRLETAVASNHEEIVSQLARALVSEAARAPGAAPMPELAPRHMKYFKQDEDIFEPAPQARIAAVVSQPAAEDRRGARLTITRLQPVAEAPQPAASEETAPGAAAPSADNGAADETSAPTQPSRRIVIVRHKPGEDVDVPLQGDLAQSA